PTAQTILVAGTLATALRKSVVPVIGGLATIFQEEPFQCSMRTGPRLLPTAQALFAETAATPTNPMVFGKGGLETALHCEPFQCSISVKVSLSGSGPAMSPTAHTLLVEIAETARSSLKV